MQSKFYKAALVSTSIALVLAGCESSSSDTDVTTDSGSTTETTTDTIETTSDVDLSEWRINNADLSTEIFESASSGTGVVTEVQVAESAVLNETDYMHVQATGIPKYDVTVTQNIVDDLDGRPRAATDFNSGATTATVDQLLSFGENINYDTSGSDNCTDTGGDGYWPPGPACPIQTDKDAYFAAEPVATTEICEVGLGMVGMMVNGVSIYSWGDGMSYGQSNWFNLAPVAEQYDVDICGGHSANGDYHHHAYTSCLANLVGDDSSDHSPIYGYAADGYPLYGPYESDGELAVSGWALRDYTADTDAGGCGTGTTGRSCVLNNEYDLSQGVDESVTAGPDFDTTVETLSGNELVAENGYYYEDYYYASELALGSQLDQYNGHNNDDGRGYHYHITLLEGDDGELSPSFPYNIGPRFAGELDDNASYSCDDGSTTATGPGGEAPVDGMGPPE